MDKHPSPPAVSDVLSRRSLLKLGVVGTVALTSTSMVASLSGCSRQEEAKANGFEFLRDADLALFAALIPTVLGANWHEGPAEQPALNQAILHNIDGACARLGKPAQGEIIKLLDLLHLRLTRWLTTGIWGNWSSASSDQLQHFLERWHNSSIGPFNAGYRVLTKLITVSWYALPASRRYAGYPGPLSTVFQAVNS